MDTYAYSAYSTQCGYLFYPFIHYPGQLISTHRIVINICIPLFIRVPANFRSLVYYYGIATGGREEWDFTFDQLLQTSVASESMKLMHGLAASPEPWILSR